MELFYSSMGNEVQTLSQEESFHCIRVLRKKNGDQINLVDGKGNFLQAMILLADEKKCRVQVLSRTGQPKRNFSLHICISPTKRSDRFEWFLEKSTEIGIEHITPLITQRTERSKMNMERMNKILVSSMKQSVQAYLPQLNGIQKLQETLKDNSSAQKFIGQAGDYPSIKEVYKKGSNVMILIGPEGDFTPDEMQSAIGAGCIPVSLGNSRLRTETAGVVACHSIALLNQ